MARYCEMNRRSTTSGPGPDDQDVVDPIYSIAHTLRGALSLVWTWLNRRSTYLPTSSNCGHSA